jgi:hypothetical protein
MTAPNLASFFSTYAVASLGSDPGRLAAMYAPTFLVAGPQGSQAFANDDAFREWLGQVRAANLESGMRTLSPAAVDVQVLSPAHVLANVTWAAVFEKTGDTPVTFRIAYLLETAPEIKILAYVSEADEAEEKKKLGL